MKYGKLSLMLAAVLLLSFLAGNAAGYFYQENQQGSQLPVTEADDPGSEAAPEADLTEEIEEPVVRKPRPEDGNAVLEEVFPDYIAAMGVTEDHFTEYSEAERAEAEELLSIADEKIFLRKGYTWNFSESQGYVNEILDSDIIHQYYVYNGKGNDLLMSMFPAAKGLRISNKRLNLTKGLEEEIHVTYSMQRTEDLPAGAGGRCWIQFDNYAQKGELSECGIILFPGDKAYEYMTFAGTRLYQAIADLSALNQDELLKFDFIRMDGVSYVYANGEFLFSYDDDIIGKVSFKGGSELFKGGNRVHCQFDDFAMTYR